MCVIFKSIGYVLDPEDFYHSDLNQVSENAISNSDCNNSQSNLWYAFNFNYLVADANNPQNGGCNELE